MYLKAIKLLKINRDFTKVSITNYINDGEVDDLLMLKILHANKAGIVKSEFLKFLEKD